MSSCSIDPDGLRGRLTRRTFIGGSAAALAIRPNPGASGQGERLYADVLRYQGFGHHRTASRGDVQTSRWIGERLRRLGFSVQLQPFARLLFEPEMGSLSVAGGTFRVFPLWPVRETPVVGISGPLAAAPLAGPGMIALVRLPYAPNASFAFPGYAGPIHAAIEARPDAIVGVTEGPTGQIIALNVPADANPWAIPVALVGSHDADRLMGAAANRVPANLRLRARRRAATAYNVIARRPGNGQLMVVSTPTSGWFTCAGERGAGVALFLALAEHCATRLDRPLLFLATSGHEFENAGSGAALAAAGPDPSSVGGWIHIGANAAGADIDLSGHPIRRIDRPFGQRGVAATAPLFAATARSFQGVAGFSPVVQLDDTNATGDLSHYLRAGYTSLMGLVGAHPLHHTTLDVAQLATTPNLLDQAFRPLRQTADQIAR